MGNILISGKSITMTINGNNDSSKTNTTKVLVVEDDSTLANLLSEVLTVERFDVEIVSDGESALQEIPSFNPDVVLLDLILPGADGIEVCQKLRAITDAYIIMVTGRDQEVDKIVGLSVGADDYMIKPVSPRELVARVKAMMRRPREASSRANVRRFGDLLINPKANTVTIGQQNICLTKLEFDLLETLSSNPNVTFSRSDLIERIWGPGWVGDGHVVDVHIANLRSKIGDGKNGLRYISTVRGVGYRMDPAI